MAHLDAGATGDGRRLVYGGHTIGLAAAQADARAAGAGDDPRLARLRPHRRRCSRATCCARGSSSSAASRCPAAAGSCTCARASPPRAPAAETEADVLDWRFVAVLA